MIFLLKKAKQTGAALPISLVLLLLFMMMVTATFSLTIAIPSFQSTTTSKTLQSYTTAMIASAQLARTEAMKRNTVVRICPSSNGTICATGNWNQGWIVMIPSSTTVLHRRQPLDAKYSVKSAANVIDFQATGTGASQTNITLCQAAPSPGNEETILTVSATGRTMVSKTTTGSCTL